MAYMNQDKKKKIRAELDKILKPAKVKYTLGVRNHSTIVLNIKSGPVDFIGNYIENLSNDARSYDNQKTVKYLDVNPYHYQNHFTGEVKEILNKIFSAMNNGNHDNSDAMTDYFDVGWYVDVNIGKWNKPYNITA
jgi:hypothetical protein